MRKLCEHARRPFFRSGYVVEFWPYEVERPKQRKFQPLVFPVRPYYAVEHLLYARIYPPFLRYRPEHERRFVFVELFVGAHSVNLGSRREYYAFTVFYALFNYVYIGFVVEVVNPQRIFDVQCGGCYRNERHYGVAGFYLLFHPVRVFYYVFLLEFKALVPQAVLDFIRRQIGTDYRPICLL